MRMDRKPNPVVDAVREILTTLSAELEFYKGGVVPTDCVLEVMDEIAHNYGIEVTTE